MDNINTDFSRYKVLHLHELKTALKELDEVQYPAEANEIKRLISAGGYQYPVDEKVGQRPFIITLLVIVGIIGGIFSIPLLSSSHAQQIGYWYQVFLSAGILMAFICHIGFWLMKKWSVYLYIGFIISVQLILAKMGLWQPQSLIEPSIVIVIVLSYMSRMR